VELINYLEIISALSSQGGTYQLEIINTSPKIKVKWGWWGEGREVLEISDQ